MKNKLTYSSLLILILVLVGCETNFNPTTSETISNLESNNFTLQKRGGYPADAGEAIDGLYTIWADKTTEAGTVTIADGVVTITSNGLYDLHSIRIFIWDDQTEIPDYRPEPGHADFTLQNVQSNEVTLDLSEESFSYISISILLSTGVKAYVGGSNYPAGFPEHRGVWWGYIGYSSEPCPICTDCNPC